MRDVIYSAIVPSVSRARDVTSQSGWLDLSGRKNRARQLDRGNPTGERGLIDADLGSGLIKQRVARVGKGRSGGYRTIVAYRHARRAVFLYGFAKSERENIGPEELAALRRIGSNWLNASSETIVEALDESDLEEVGL